VELIDYNEEEIAIFRSRIMDSPLITFKQGTRVQTSTNLNAGGQFALGGNRFCSVGYRARKGSTGQGFVTAGHCVCFNDVWTIFGRVRERQFGGRIDAAWLDTSGATGTPTNNFHNWNLILGSQPLPPLPVLSTAVVTPTVGQNIGRIGRTSGHRLGRVSEINVSFVSADTDRCMSNPICPVMTHQILTTVHQMGGDSGGVVYLTSNRSTLGIGTFRRGTQMIFSSAQNINNAFGLSRY